MKIQNKALFDLLTAKNKLIEQGRKISVKIESLETERNKLALQVQKIKDKVIPLVTKAVEGKLGEYEEVSEVKTGKTINEVEIDITDELEQFKAYLKDRKTQNETEDTANK